MTRKFFPFSSGCLLVPKPLSANFVTATHTRPPINPIGASGKRPDSQARAQSPFLVKRPCLSQRGLNVDMPCGIHVRKVLIFAANMTCLKVRYARIEILCMVQISSHRDRWVKAKLSQKRMDFWSLLQEHRAYS